MSVNLLGSNCNGQALAAQPMQVQPKGRNLASLSQVLLGQIFKFLPLEDMVSGQRICKTFRTGFRLWEQRTGTVDGQLLARYLKRNGAISENMLQGQLPTAQIREIRKIGSQIKELALLDFELGALLALFTPPKEGEEPLFQAVKSLKIDLKFSKAMDAGWRRQRRRGVAEAPTVSYTNEQIFGMIRALIFHCPQLERIYVGHASRGSGEEIVREIFSAAKYLTHVVFHEGGDGLDYSVLAKLCPKLQDLRFTSDFALTVADDENMENLFSIPQLRSLELGRGCSDKGLEKIPQNHGLEELWIYSPDNGPQSRLIDNGPQSRVITNKGLAYLVRLTNLQRLTITNSSQLTDLSFVSQMKSLTSLTLRAMYGGIAPLVKTIAEHGNITHLFVEGGWRDEEDFKELGKCAELRSLILSDIEPDVCITLTDKSLADLAGCKKLEVLALGTKNQRTNFTTEGVIALVRDLPALTTLNLSKCFLAGVSVAKVEQAFIQDRPQLFVMRHERDEKKGVIFSLI